MNTSSSTGSSGTASSGGSATGQASSGTSGTTGGTTGGAGSTRFVGTAIVPPGTPLPQIATMELTIAATGLTGTPVPSGTVAVTGQWNDGSPISGTFNTIDNSLTATSPAYNATFVGDYSGEYVSGHWSGSGYYWYFGVAMEPPGGEVYTFCGASTQGNNSYGPVISSDGTISGVEVLSGGNTGVLTGTDSNGSITLNGVGYFTFTTEPDGGAALTGSGFKFGGC